tara:strand:- start:1534 stop:1776 length:243 start_codon:yes stop_codon:yes gene_type:complete
LSHIVFSNSIAVERKSGSKPFWLPVFDNSCERAHRTKLSDSATGETITRFGKPAPGGSGKALFDCISVEVIAPSDADSLY